MTNPGPYELLAKIMIDIHGSLQEVKFLEKPKTFELVFSDGTLLKPSSEDDRKHWYLNHRQSLLEYLNAGYGGDPLHVLTFGYSGTGSHNLVRFLKSCGFTSTEFISAETHAAHQELPFVLKADGSRTPLSLEAGKHL